MSTKASSDSNAKTVEDVQKLLALAQGGSNEDESRNAALKAVQLMQKHDLRVIPASELQRVEGIAKEAREMVANVKAENRTNMIIGGLIGAALSRGKIF
jgi:hypothetical protein